MQLQRAALSGISLYAGVYRPSDITIEKSKHQPPGAHLVAELIEKLCDYANEHLAVASPIHLASYVLWRLNWIHPFTDGNGRTARAVAYLVLSVRVGMILPGTNTIPEQIIAKRKLYYDALEAADTALEQGQVDVAAVEQLMSGMLAGQLLSVLK